MGELRTRMINAMQLRRFSPRTQESYLALKQAGSDLTRDLSMDGTCR
jgi:hypothetical protein